MFLDFLKLVAAVVFGLMLVVILTVAYLRWRIKRWVGELGDEIKKFGDQFAMMGGGMEPLEVELERTQSSPSPQYQSVIEGWTSDVESLGFERVGDFHMQPTAVWMRALTHPESGAAAVVYVMEPVGVFYDLVAKFENDDSVTVTDNQYALVDFPPWSQVVRLDAGTDPSVAYSRLLDEVGSQPVQPYDPINFRERFEAAYRKDMLWRAKRGDTPQEVRRVMNSPLTEAQGNNDLVQATMESRREMRAAQFEDFLRKQYLKQSQLSALEYERIEERMVIVHELTPSSTLLELAEEAFWDDEADEEQPIPDVVLKIAEEDDPLEAFRRIQEYFPSPNYFEHYDSVAGEITGDIYLRPAD
ncbi:hypothetical protein [Thalassoroseus pseudoceratinae]|uniref:hypothetical protein n=1 Tax=Thalassoroseus pseudoceratinae TaxID=2713176 RepID=UPI00198058B4|nr:hypothetical protein [Thalassoroseus pseudoceratinae]